MAKEKVKHLSGVFASVFAHAGHISKEQACAGVAAGSVAACN